MGYGLYQGVNWRDKAYQGTNWRDMMAYIRAPTEGIWLLLGHQVKGYG
jgi:hypothetical protein